MDETPQREDHEAAASPSRETTLTDRLRAAAVRALPGLPGVPGLPELPQMASREEPMETASATVTLSDLPAGYQAFVYGELMIDDELVREDSATAMPGETVEFEFSYDASEREESPARVSVLTSTEIEHLGSDRSTQE